MNRRIRNMLFFVAVLSGGYLVPRAVAPRPRIDPKCRVNVHTGQPSNEFRDVYESYACADNVEACAAEAREALAKVSRRRWGPFDFLCSGGKVAKVYSPEDSPISRDYIGFIQANPRLFGLGAESKFELEPDDGTQLYRGVRAAAGASLLKKHDAGRYGDENFSELTVSLVDTARWKFVPQDAILPEAAIEAARRYWGPERPEEVAGWLIEDPQYRIRSNPPAGSDCPRKPGGAWFVRGRGEAYPGKSLKTPYFKEAIVDGETGEACSFSGNGTPLLAWERRPSD
jgi:hypothetical protein